MSTCMRMSIADLKGSVFIFGTVLISSSHMSNKFKEFERMTIEFLLNERNWLKINKIKLLAKNANETLRNKLTLLCAILKR